MTEQKPTSIVLSKSEIPAHLMVPENADINRMLEGYVSPPRIKIVQGTTKPPISDVYAPGDAILTPTLTELAKKGQPFSFTPLFFYPEWLYTNPMEAEQFIIARSLDPKSDIARLSRDPQTRKHPWEKDATKSCNYTEVLTFIVSIVGHEELQGVQCAMAFQKAEYRTGSTFASSIKMRKVPMTGTVWDAVAKQRTNKAGTWWGFDIKPSQTDRGLVLEASQFDAFNQAHATLKTAFNDSKLVVAHDLDVEEQDVTAEAAF